MKYYSACGLNFCANFKLPYFSRVEKENIYIKFILRKNLKKLIPAKEEILLQRSNFFITQNCFYYNNSECEFLYLHEKKILYYNHINKQIFNLFITSLLFKFLGYFYNFILFHAAAFCYKNKNIIYAGKTGTGKSTLLYKLLNNDEIKIFCDDIVPVFFSCPDSFYSAFPFIKLWGADILNKNKELSPVIDNINKYYIVINKNFSYSLNKSDVIFVVELTSNDRLKFEEIKGKNKFTNIFDSIYKPSILSILQNKTEFKIITSLVSNTKIYKITKPININQNIFYESFKKFIESNVI